MSPAEQAVLERFGENLRVNRVVRRITQEGLAFAAEVHRTQVSLMESGQRSPRIPTFIKLCGALGVSPEVLLEGIAWKPGDHDRGSFQVAENDRP